MELTLWSYTPTALSLEISSNKTMLDRMVFLLRCWRMEGALCVGPRGNSTRGTPFVVPMRKFH